MKNRLLGKIIILLYYSVMILNADKHQVTNVSKTAFLRSIPHYRFGPIECLMLAGQNLRFSFQNSRGQSFNRYW